VKITKLEASTSERVRDQINKLEIAAECSQQTNSEKKSHGCSTEKADKQWSKMQTFE